MEVGPDSGQEVGVQLWLGHLHRRLSVYLLRERPYRLYDPWFSFGLV